MESLEGREAPVSATAPTTLLGAAAFVHTAEPPSQTHDAEKSSTIAYSSMDALSDQDQPVTDGVFRQLVAQSLSLADYDSFSDTADQLPSVDDAAERHTSNDPALDAVMAADQALVDPVFHPAPNAADGPHHAGPSMGNGVNGTPPNFAGAGQGPGGASTPFAGGGGNSSGSGGGGPVGGNLATLANEGAFAPQLTSGPAAPTLQAAVSASPPPPRRHQPQRPLRRTPPRIPRPRSRQRALLSPPWTTLAAITLSAAASAATS